MTTIYFMRHSEVLKVIHENNNDSLQLQNEKTILTTNGEQLAKEKSTKLPKFDKVYSSNYTRAICTAKYFSDEVFIDESFGERKFGISDWNELPSDFAERQFRDHNYKIGDGESLNEVFERETKALDKILEEDKDTTVLIVGHATALAVLLSKWCEVSYSGPYKFNGIEFFDGKWNYCETFKLIFNNNNLIDIENIK